MTLKIKRAWSVFFVKQTLTMLLVTAGGLLALLMSPGELLGDRCAQLLVAVLIVITTLQTDLGLGNLSYLIWVDYFSTYAHASVLSHSMQQHAHALNNLLRISRAIARPWNPRLHDAAWRGAFECSSSISMLKPQATAVG